MKKPGKVPWVNYQVKASQLQGHYPTKVNVSDEQMAALDLTPRQSCPQWKDRLHPRTPTP